MDAYSDPAQVEIWQSRGPEHYLLEKPAMYCLLPEKLHGKVVLCAGCADGVECDLLIHRGATVIGIDSSEYMISLARLRHPAGRFIVGSIEDLGAIETESIDYVFSSLTLHYIEDWTLVFTEFRRVLRAGGGVVLLGSAQELPLHAP